MPYKSGQYNEDLKVNKELAKEKLHSNYRYLVIKHVHLYLKKKGIENSFDAEEIVQKVWKAITDHSNKVGNGEIERDYESLSAFIIKTTFNVCNEYSKRVMQDRYTQLDECYEIPDTRQKSVEENFDDKERLESIFKDLNDVDSEFLYLHTYGYTYAEIGQRMQMTAQNARIRIFRIKQKINKCSK